MLVNCQNFVRTFFVFKYFVIFILPFSLIFDLSLVSLPKLNKMEVTVASMAMSSFSVAQGLTTRQIRDNYLLTECTSEL